MHPGVKKIVDSGDFTFEEFEELAGNLGFTRDYHYDWLLKLKHPEVDRALKGDVLSLGHLRRAFQKAKDDGGFIAAEANYQSWLVSNQQEDLEGWGEF